MVLFSAVKENMFLNLVLRFAFADYLIRLQFCYGLDLQCIFEMSFAGYPKNGTKITKRKGT